MDLGPILLLVCKMEVLVVSSLEALETEAELSGDQVSANDHHFTKSVLRTFMLLCLIHVWTTLPVLYLIHLYLYLFYVF